MSRSSKRPTNEEPARKGRHARQSSEVSFTGDYEGDMRSISRMLERISPEFRDEEGFNPLDVVIEIMKSENLDSRKQDLETDCRSMESAMDTIVAAHYESFNKAISNYTAILGIDTESLSSVTGLHETAEKCSALFSSRSHSVSNMYMQSLEYQYMIEILDKVDFIKQVPDKYAIYLGEGKYLEASELLVRATDMLSQSDMLNITALQHRRELIADQRLSFHETVSEVLNDLLYLKYEDADESDELHLRRKSVFTALANQQKRAETQKPNREADDNLRLTSPLMSQLVDALFVLGREREATLELMERIRPELRLIIKRTISIVKQEADYDPPQISKANPREEQTESELFARMLSIVFERCKRVLANHKFVCGVFIDKFRKKEVALGHVGKVGAAGRSAVAADGEAFSASKCACAGWLLEKIELVGDYTIDSVWDEMQKEVMALIGFYIEAEFHDFKRLDIAHSQKLFSFSASAAFSAPEDRDAKKWDYSEINMGTPSPYKLAPVYPIIVSFSDAALSLLLPMSLPSTLKAWIDDFVHLTFLQHIKHDYRLRAAAASHGPDAFRLKDQLRSAYNSSESQRPILSSTSTLYQCIKELYQDIIFMPSYAREFHSIMEMLLIEFHEVCLAVFLDALKESEVGRLLQIEEVMKTCYQDPLWKRLQNSMIPTKISIGIEAGLDPTDPFQSRVASDPFAEMMEDDPSAKPEHELSLYRGSTSAGQPLTKKLLISDPSKLSLLSLLHDSLSWMCDKLENLDQMVDRPASLKKNPNSREKSNSAQFSIRKGHNRQKSMGSSGVIAKPQLSANIMEMIARFRDVSDQSLIAIKTEFRIRAFYFLDALRRSSYTYDMEMKEADKCVQDFNTDLRDTFDIFYTCLPSSRLKYIYGGLPRLLSNILISALSRLEGINKNGVQKMIRNVFALQQNLTNYIPFDQEPFDRVRRFYELLNMKPDEILQQIVENAAEPTKLFDFAEYKSVLEFYYPDRTIPESVEKDLQNKLGAFVQSRNALKVPIIPIKLATPGSGSDRTPSARSGNTVSIVLGYLPRHDVSLVTKHAKMISNMDSD